MKKSTLLSISVFSLFITVFSGCGDDGLENPGYPAIPAIKFEKVKFIEVGTWESDTLKLTISYKDGDSDLGLDGINPEDHEPPYHEWYHFIENGSGDTIPVASQWMFGLGSVIVSAPASGLLVTDETRQKPNYDYLPEYNPESCSDYAYTFVHIKESLHIIDESFTIQDTIVSNGEKYIEIQGPLLYRSNENYYNIFVDFYVFKNGSFEKFDWFEEYCISYDGRFPLILDKPGGTFKSGIFKVNIKTPWEGKITYNMRNSSFLAIFGDNPIKLAITIKDRALNTSNTIITPEFTLNSIK